tara:strand:- start:127 stop:423 length:297 start_codon:yes stop_codon:yes gene_type:complete
MKIYVGDNKAKAKQMTFQDLLIAKIREAGIGMDNGGFYDENCSWVGIVQDDATTNDKNPSQVTINFTFDHEEDTIKEINVWKSNIITIVDDEHMKKII